MSTPEDIQLAAELFAETIFRAINEALGGSQTTQIAIGRKEISVVLQSLAKVSGFFISNCPPDQIDEFADIVRAYADGAAEERRQHMAHAGRA
ncbi:hypothetical protein [Parvularcula sp. LCG005]|uniref:hypothetical protein n=1 Tax=Parvularcula sp. LCG005 TaxID=3078805 RepID=UPI002942D7BF|nr:hypothetical protein [Parvularcula sp. LCG005]WOI54284.1 hypothetical protein RUI03_04610 [Parvularcula sp. LCG005]